jgi:3-oxoacyl-[acyl-carrier protein] reductase
MIKVVFITGASRGIGLATVKKFSENGWSVAAFYNQTPGPKIKNVKWYQLEITSYESIKKAFDSAFKDLGRIDSFVNSAGIFGYKKMFEYDEETIDSVMAVNEKGAYLTTKEIMNKMAEGSIVYVSSTAAQLGSNDPVYAGTKGALLSLTKSMAKALAPKVRVNCIAPGVTRTEMTENMNQERLKQLIDMTLLKRIAEPEDMADAIYFLASDESKHITGTCLNVSGGYVLS